MDYDLSDPDRPDADLVSYAAGHKAMGLYAMWALRDEVAAVADPALLPAGKEQRLRLEDLLGFRRNPITATPLFREYGARALDGHPTPATPFVRLATGASGVGVASSIGLAIGAADRYGADAPRVHIMEGEGVAVGHLDDVPVVQVEELARVPLHVVAGHGAGHGLCSEGFYEAVAELARTTGAEVELPTCDPADRACAGPDGATVRERCFWTALQAVRAQLHQDRPLAAALAERLAAARDRLDARERAPRPGAARVDDAYELAEAAAQVAPGPEATPEELRLEPGTHATLRGELGRALHHLQAASGGAFLVAAADLAGSTSVSAISAGSPSGFWDAHANIDARLLSVGGICEDAIAGVLSGISAYGHDLGVGSSYGAFMAPLGHIAARLHAIGSQAKKSVTGEPYKPMILVCAHAGLKTGEDGPTHADPQPLQLLQEDFPRGTAVSLVPWEPQEIWTLTAAALAQRPAVISAFVTRPTEPVLDRPGLGLAPAEAAVSGVYRLRDSEVPDVTVVLQESAVTYAFVQQALPILEEKGVDALVYYVASAELFDLLPEDERRAILPEARAAEAVGITGFTLPTLYRWVTSEAGRAASLYPFMKGHYLGSGPGDLVLAEAGLDGESQAAAILRYCDARAAH